MARFDSLPSLFPEPLEPPRVSQQRCDGPGYLVDRFSVDQHAGLSIDDGVDLAARSTSNHRPAPRSRFEVHQSVAFQVAKRRAAGGQHEDSAAPILVLQRSIVQSAEEVHPVGDAFDGLLGSPSVEQEAIPEDRQEKMLGALSGWELGGLSSVTPYGMPGVIAM